MGRANESHAYLKIWDFDCHPNKISLMLGLTPHKVVVKGEKRGNAPDILNKSNGWIYKSKLDMHKSIEGHVDEVIRLIITKNQEIANLPEGIYIELACCVYVYDSPPAIHLNPEQIKILNDINAHYDFDLYCFKDD